MGQGVQPRRGVSQRGGPPPVDSAPSIQNHVGAIIGTGGNNVREITKESKARVVVDVQRTVKDQQGHSEKIISILGHLENCSKAFYLKYLVQLELKIRAHNQLVGRLIGKQGATIKRIMQDTGTTIFVSKWVHVVSLLVFHLTITLLTMERTITVKGPSIEVVRLMSFTGIPAMPGMIHPIGDAYAALAASTMRPIGGPMCGVGGRVDVPKTTRMWVPNSMVGAIIGSKGGNIRNIIRNSGANVRIEGGGERKEAERKEEPEKKEEGSGDAQSHGEGEEKFLQDGERLVTITGNDAQQYRAQFLIFNRVAEQSQHLIDEVSVKLRTELTVPSRLVGRIIGKGGQNVRELQRITGASVSLDFDYIYQFTFSIVYRHRFFLFTIVRIVGNFLATQSVQVRIGQLIADFQRATNLHGDRRKEEPQGIALID
ncbi:unnamed protein product [Haemonchus placei]|uniref:KH domain-containing protein n=1 Tax=Haemonchus placei TaxID=6290 RepID=A0A0N4WNH0_HAEPC|nr:unnamed protein product [Haemonchus placei]